MQTTSTTSSGRGEDDRYDEFRANVQTLFDSNIKLSPRVFTTDASGLWQGYLDAAPGAARQERTCKTCERFIETYGGLVVIDVDGRSRPALWQRNVPRGYALAASVLIDIVARANVTGVFLSDHDTPLWGLPETRRPVSKPFTHLSVRAPESALNRSRTKTAAQVMAEKVEDYGMLQRSLADFPAEIAKRALAFLLTGGLQRADKHVDLATWLVDLHDKRAATSNARHRENLVWRAVADAPAGWCHIRSGMLGTLLEDVAAGKSLAEIRRRYDEKMNPTRYLRPQAPPTLGNIAQAEKLVASMGLAPALERRFALLSDVGPGVLWTPKASPAPATVDGVFGHLKPSAKSDPIDTGAAPARITWVKFRDTVMPSAETVGLCASPLHRLPFAAMVAPQNPDAPAILQWDREGQRNGVSWYMYDGGSLPSRWAVRAGTFHPVIAIVASPAMWDPLRPTPTQAPFVMLVLEGAHDVGYERGAGFFPELLRSDLHEVRATLEAYAKSAVIRGVDKAEVCGLALQKSDGGFGGAVVRVVSKGIVSRFELDRWD